MNRMLALAFGASLLALSLAVPVAAAPTAPNPADNRLMIVDGNTDEVIYDDGRDDLFCVTRVHAWRDWRGHLHHHRRMRCR